MTTIVSVASHWKLTPAESEILWILYRKASYVSVEDLAEYTDRPHSTDEDYHKADKTIRVLLTRLRKKLPEGSIKAKYGVGYRLMDMSLVDAI